MARKKQQEPLVRSKERTKKASATPKFKIVEGRIDIDHPSPEHGWGLYMVALGTGSFPFALEIHKQLINALSIGREGNPEALNFGIAVIASIKPRDELETMLAAQMEAIHTTTMTFARRLNHVENIPQQDSAERTLNKLARTFTTQMEALKRYCRNDGEQKVVVQHVNVNDGGQAIVGTIEQKKDRGEG